jgi:hypothetical protein
MQSEIFLRSTAQVEDVTAGSPSPQISKVIKIGQVHVEFTDQFQYMPNHLDAFGQKRNLQFAIIPVIPKLIKGNLFAD